MVYTSFHCHESGVSRVSNKVNRLPGNSETGLELGAHRDQVYYSAEGFDDGAVKFVTTVVPDPLSYKASADSYLDSPHAGITSSALASHTR